MAAKKPTVAIVMGSKTDWPTLEHTVKTLKEFGVESTGKSHVGAPYARTKPPLLQKMRQRVDIKSLSVLQAAQHISAEFWLGILLCLSSVSLRWAGHLMGSTHCYQRCKCPKAFQ